VKNNSIHFNSCCRCASIDSADSMGEVGLVGTNGDLGGAQDRRRVGLARVNVTSGQLALRCQVVMPPCELDMMIGMGCQSQGPDSDVVLYHTLMGGYRSFEGLEQRGVVEAGIWVQYASGGSSALEWRGMRKHEY
jgi:hypothetical protein